MGIVVIQVLRMSAVGSQGRLDRFIRRSLAHATLGIGQTGPPNHTLPVNHPDLRNRIVIDRS